MHLPFSSEVIIYLFSGQAHIVYFNVLYNNYICLEPNINIPKNISAFH